VESGVLRSDATCGVLVDRARALLSELSFGQRPVLSGPREVERLFFLSPGTTAARGALRDPTGPRAHGQVNPEKYFLDVFDDGDWFLLAKLDVQAEQETWTIDQANVTKISTASDMRLRVVSGDEFLRTDIPNETEIEGTTATEVDWTWAENPEFPSGGIAFTGTYTYPIALGGTATGTAAIWFETEETRSGAKITVTRWFNPDTSGANIDLRESGNVLTLRPVRGSYSGACNTAVAEMSY
jgi:hypothetical protein